MARLDIRTAALLIATLALTAAPSFAQRDGRRGGGQEGRHQSAERGQPRGGGQSERRAEPRAQAQPQGRVESRAQAQPQGRVESRAQTQPQGRVESQGRSQFQGRVEPRRDESFRSNDSRRNDHPAYVPRAYNNRAYENRGRDSRSWNVRPYAYRPYIRSYAVPYGYRAFGAYGYRPGWSLNFYFGRPYVYGYPGYGYPDAAYGYYAIAPGHAFGALRIVDAPRDAQVFVDGYYAGVVDDYDGVFQHLNLEAGSHHVAIELQGYPPLEFDVNVEPGQTVTYHANVQ